MGVQYTVQRRVLNLTPESDTTKEVTLGYWEDMDELRLDIRKWKNGEYATGISLTESEVRRLREALELTDFGKL